MTDRSSPVDLALDLFLYAPLGAAVQARRVIPALAQAGREHLDQRLPGYRAVGQLAVTQIKRRAEDQLSSWIPGGDESGPDEVDAADAPSAPAPPTDLDAPPATPPPPPPDLPIDHYDELSAVQVLPNLTALDAVELEAIAAHERAHRSRRTILGRIDQLLEAGS